MTKFFVIGSDCCFEEEQLLVEAKKVGFEADFLSLCDMSLELGSCTKIVFNNQDVSSLLDENAIIYFRRSRGNYQKMFRLIHLLQSRSVKFFDSYEAVASNLDKSISLPAFESGLLCHPCPTVFLGKKSLNTFDFDSLEFPILTKPVLGRHGEGVCKHLDIDSVKKSIIYSEDDLILQPFLNIEEEYRIFVIGDQTMGAIVKHMADGEMTANAHGGAVFELIDLDQSFHDESIKLCQRSGINIGGVDFVKTRDGKYYLLEINRCPEFKEFSRATGINIAAAIINYLQND